ncbi:MAG: hypothetical protein J6Y47_08165 [Bacteroidales bacterium]|nr:hypothetical protein [Bacteroidales bacterium]
MRLFPILLISLILSISSVQGQKILYSTVDSVCLIDISTKQKYALLPKEKSYLWIEGKFEIREGYGIFYRYQNDFKNNTLLVKEYSFDTLTYKMLDLKDYCVLAERENHYWYHYQYKDSRFRFNNNILLKTDTGCVIFIPEEDLGKTQIRFKRGFEISDDKLICERWHVKHHSDKLWVEPAQIVEIDISTKQMTTLVTGCFSYISYDNRFILYLCAGEKVKCYGVYDLQNKEVVYKFYANYARWIL